MEVILIFLLCMNVYGLFLMGYDKSQARKHKWRIRERTLWIVAVFGGAMGMTLGMLLFRHKTKHLSFKIGFPLLATTQMIVFLYIW